MRTLGGCFAFLLLGAASGVRAAPGDLTADSALGQTDFAQNMPNQPVGLPSAGNLLPSNASDLAIAPNGRLYASDAGNNRILSWANASAFVTGQHADRVIGQPDFVSAAPNNGGVSGASLSLPQGLWVDAAGNLWVTDAFNHRVLKFNNPENDATPTTADLVIGQFDLSGNLENLGQGGGGPDVALPDSLQFPGRVIAIGADLWVADSGNSRVLHYSNVMANKPFADRVFGQYGNFFKRAKNNDGNGQNGFTASADNLLNPIGIGVNSAGSLLVADWANHRILRYDNPILGDMTADAVIGQPDFVSNTFDNGGPQAGLQLPIDLALDSIGRLFVADSGNNRALVYSQPFLSPGPDIVFGQFGNMIVDAPNHGLGPGATDADGLFGPTGVSIDPVGNLCVMDANNMRVLRFDSPLVVAGDINCDGVLNSGDAFALALVIVNPAAYHATYSPCDVLRGDISGDGQVNGADVQPFVALLIGT